MPARANKEFSLFVVRRSPSLLLCVIAQKFPSLQASGFAKCLCKLNKFLMRFLFFVVFLCVLFFSLPWPMRPIETNEVYFHFKVFRAHTMPAANWYSVHQTKRAENNEMRYSVGFLVDGRVLLGKNATTCFFSGESYIMRLSICVICHICSRCDGPFTVSPRISSLFALYRSSAHTQLIILAA